MKSMTAKDRVLAALAHEEPDRVPINYRSNPGIDARLKEHYGLEKSDHEGLRRTLGVDFAGVNAPYVGPKLHDDPPDRRVDLWGVRTRYVDHGTGGYWDFCDFPLREATVEEATNCRTTPPPRTPSPCTRPRSSTGGTEGARASSRGRCRNRCPRSSPEKNSTSTTIKTTTPTRTERSRHLPSREVTSSAGVRRPFAFAARMWLNLRTSTS